MERQLKLAFKIDYRNKLTFQSTETREFDWEQLGINPDYVFAHNEEWKQCRLEDEGWIENDGIILKKVDEEEYSERLKYYENDGLTKSDLLQDEDWKEIDGVIYTEISDEDKAEFDNFQFGWYSDSGRLISDELDILEKEEGQIYLGDDVHYWVTPTNLTLKEFKAYLKHVDHNFFEVLEERDADDYVIKFLKDKTYDLSFSDFKYLLEKISEELYYGGTLNEVLEIIGEEEEE